MPIAYLQGLAAELACSNVTEEDVARLEQLNQQFSEAIRKQEVKAIMEADVAFHRKILEMASNQYLMDFSETLFLHMQRIEFAYFRWTMDSSQSVKIHQSVIDAISARDSENAGSRMKSNWLQTMALYENKLASEK